jgi:hypothetical protein
MEITQEKIDKLFDISARLDKKEEEIRIEESKALMNVNRKIKHKDQFVNEKTLWDELRYAGANGDAGKLLKEKYPKVFSLGEEHSLIAKELSEFCQVELEINFKEVRITDIIKLCLSLVDYKLNKKK